MAARAESIPVLYIKAENHYDVGYTIGSTLKHWIRDYMATSKDVRLFRNYYATDDGKLIVEKYLTTAQTVKPDIVSEIRGIAEGSGHQFMDMFLLQIASEVLFCHAADARDSEIDEKMDKGCTDVLINGKQCRLMGHNDDWSDEVASRVSIVHVTITNDDVREKFVSYVYPGYLPGFCFGMNKDLVITLNSLHPRDANTDGVPLLILLRSLLSCRTIDECRAVMTCQPTGCAYGMNIDIAAIHGSDMCSIEVYTDKYKSRLSTKWVEYEGQSSDGWAYHHVNVYDHTVQPMCETRSQGSERRISRLKELPTPKTFSDVVNILGDTADKLEPIYRFPNETHLKPNGMTSATAIFDITNKRLHVYRNSPKDGQGPCVTLPFLKD